MKKLAIACCGLMFVGSAVAMPFTGYYKTIDDSTKNAKSIVALYPCAEIGDTDATKDELCGRIIALYDTDGKNITDTLSNATRVADKVAGSPKMVGLDVIWGMEWDNDDAQFEDGKIMDPKTGKIYSSVIWQDKKDDKSLLRVRGKIGPFGRTQVWHLMVEKDLPTELQKLDTTNWTPKPVLNK